ncbi:MAG: hypothetical protein JXO22_01015 [Phycisphaerae bacterium]|nr:hypothetical protein [Phycisphaerae bacterium]
MNHRTGRSRPALAGLLAFCFVIGGCPTATQPTGDTSGDTTPVANTAPTADAGEDQTVTAGDTIVLNATGSSDPDGDPITYFWQQTEGTITLEIPSPGAAITRVDTPADLAEMTAVTLEITVIDSQSYDSDTIQITIVPRD